MLASDRHALQDIVLSVLARSSWYELRACDAQVLVNDVLGTMRTILADACYHWNQLKSMPQLPPEVLAGCFAFLPFQGRITATHVCRTWRAAALEAPSLWNNLTGYSEEDAPSLSQVQMALARAGNLPIEIDYHGWVVGDAAVLVETYLHRITSLGVHKYPTLHFLDHPAPLLHTLCLVDDASLSEDFLGRIPGRLTTLHAERLYISAPCPPLSTLKTLRATLSSGMTLQNIFTICPRLQTLSLRHIAREHVTEIGLPPHSLSTLVLSTGDGDCDLLAIYEAYKGSAALRHIDLVRYTAGFPHDFGRAIHGAVELGVELPDQHMISVTAHFAGGRKLTISWELSSDPFRAERRRYPPVFAQPAPCFDQLRTVRLRTAVLPGFIRAAPFMPALEQLCVDLAPPMDPSSQTRGFQWTELDVLRQFDVPRLILKLTHPRGLSADDAHSLLEYLRSSGMHRAITVAGFAADAIPSDVPPNLNARFVLEEQSP